MDFPDISLVLQVGLPLNSDAYIHRVGRTARAGKSGRAIIMLTEAETFYLKSNQQFPIKPYPASEQVANDSTSEPMVQQAMQNIDDKKKQKAYSAYLGFMRAFESKLRINSSQLVQMANQFAMKGMGCPEPPGMDKTTVRFVLQHASSEWLANNVSRRQEDGPQRGSRDPLSQATKQRKDFALLKLCLE